MFSIKRIGLIWFFLLVVFFLAIAVEPKGSTENHSLFVNGSCAALLAFSLLFITIACIRFIRAISPYVKRIYSFFSSLFYWVPGAGIFILKFIILISGVALILDGACLLFLKPLFPTAFAIGMANFPNIFSEMSDSSDPLGIITILFGMMYSAYGYTLYRKHLRKSKYIVFLLIASGVVVLILSKSFFVLNLNLILISLTIAFRNYFYEVEMDFIPDRMVLFLRIIWKIILYILLFISAVFILFILSTYNDPNAQHSFTFKTRTWDINLPDGRHYSGQEKSGVPNGTGVLTWPDGKKYEGEFIDGQITGKGNMTLTNGVRYEGSFVNGSGQGKGKIYFIDSTIYEGNFDNGKPIGHGTCKKSDSTEFVCDIHDGQYIEYQP
jgi:hypothetical protein